MAGDYADGEYNDTMKNLFDLASEGKFKDISEDVILALAEDSHYREEFEKVSFSSFGDAYRPHFAWEWSKKFGKGQHRSYFVGSDSVDGLMYEIKEWGDGSFTCSCPAFHFHPEKDCKHITRVKSKN